MGNFFKDTLKGFTSNIAQGVTKIAHGDILKGTAQTITGTMFSPATGASAAIQSALGIDNKTPIVGSVFKVVDDSGSGYGLIDGDYKTATNDALIAGALYATGGASGILTSAQEDPLGFMGSLMEQGGGASNPGKPLQPIIPRVPQSQGSNILPFILIGGGVIVFLILRRK